MDIGTDQDDKSTNAINVTPLVDVCLVLVLVFMVTSPLSVLYGINVSRKMMKAFGLTTPQEHVVVRLGTAGINFEDKEGNKHPVSYDDFGAALHMAIQNSKTKEVHLKIERSVPHGQTVWAMDLAKQNGAADVAILKGE